MRVILEELKERAGKLPRGEGADEGTTDDDVQKFEDSVQLLEELVERVDRLDLNSATRSFFWRGLHKPDQNGREYCKSIVRVFKSTT